MIYYFTGTGNSRYIARELHQQLNEDYISMNTLIRNNDHSLQNIGSLTVVSIFSLTKSLKTLIISMLLSFFIVKFVKLYVGICRNVWYNSCRR